MSVPITSFPSNHKNITLFIILYMELEHEDGIAFDSNLVYDREMKFRT